MALDTISLSDIGQSLVAIETEIKSNISTIAYYKEQIVALSIKNETLQGVAKAILNTACPKTMDY